MKKTLLLFAAFLASIGMNAQTLTVPDVYIQKGGTASFGLVVDVPANSYAGFQFETTLPTGITYTEKTSASSAWDGTFQTSAANFKGSASSGKLTPIPAGGVVIATAEIAADASMAVGEYDVTISNFEFLGYTGGAEDKKIADVTFKVIVTDNIVLDENSVVAPATTTTAANMLVKRTIKANEWSTICFPFPISIANLKTALYDNNFQLGEFSGYDAEKDGDGKVVNLKLKFKEFTASGIKANTPLIIKTTRDISEFEVSAKLTPNDAPSTIINELNEETFEEEETCRMQGTFTAGTVVPKNSLFLSGNKFYYSAGKTKMKGFRAYFTLKDVLADVASADARIFISFDDATGVKTMKAVDNENYYDLQGRRVSEPTKKGLYIRGNKKVFIK